jgi:cytoskeletal protein CcmA (bactofilin family)
VVSVHGRIDGHISADRVELGPTAHVAASIVSPRVSVEDGAHLSGQVNTERAQAAGSVARHRQKAGSEP